MINAFIKEYIDRSGFNYISKEEAIDERYVGLKIFDEPLIGYADANDSLFNEYVTNEEILNGHFMHPNEWLKEAKTIISVFFPFTNAVKESNMEDINEPSNEWLHGRYEGQMHLNNLTKHLMEKIIEAGYKCVAPAFDNRYKGSYSKERKSNKDFGGNWSERHGAYAAGLGTFGLSKGLITKHGMAGRYLSLITEMEVEPTTREYTAIYEYCSMCGACVRSCPADAISQEEGKLHAPCNEYLAILRRKNSPRYGCGKCQVGVPCMNKAPIIIKKN